MELIMVVETFRNMCRDELRVELATQFDLFQEKGDRCSRGFSWCESKTEQILVAIGEELLLYPDNIFSPSIWSRKEGIRLCIIRVWPKPVTPCRADSGVF